MEKNSKTRRKMTYSPNSFDDNELLECTRMMVGEKLMHTILAIIERNIKNRSKCVHQTPSTTESETSLRTSPMSNSKILSTSEQAMNPREYEKRKSRE